MGVQRRTFLTASAAGGLWLVTGACSGGSSSRATPRRLVPAPAAMVRTSWSTDPWSSGSYSFLGVGAEPKSRVALAATLGNRVFFAGEATSSESPSTVHGAMQSGDRAAGEVLGVAGARERVVVVGAGIAGLTAARRIAADGHDVTVFEARTRVGGRLDTFRPNGWPIPVERGASWIHDISASDLDRRMKALDIDTVPFDYKESVAGSDGRRVDDVDAIGSLAEETLTRATTWASDQDQDRSLAAAVADSNAAHATGIDEASLTWYLDTEIATEYGASAAELSAWWGLEEGTEGDDLLVTGGYMTLATDIASGLVVEFERPVSRIQWNEKAASVSDTNGTSIDADRVIVTIPLGVLKAGAIAFEPALPPAKQAAIDTMGMGLLDKFWFRFDEQFWTDSALMWTRLGPSESPFTEWFNLAPATGHPVLLALLGGTEARDWATRDDHDVEQAAVASLQAFLDAGW